MFSAPLAYTAGRCALTLPDAVMGAVGIEAQSQGLLVPI